MSSSEQAAAPGRKLAHPAREEIRLEAVLHALADRVRLRIVCELADGHTDMACMTFGLPVSKSTSTHHFRVLREAGVIRQHYEGTSRMNRLRSDDLEVLFPGLLRAVLRAQRQSAPATP
ncbi:ArsR/SmtB family transcription factor [Actinoalloteichus hymeniacidonis]|uniref:Transcriptional regulator, ArsR family n=1 Tax=Actinoalloteichus hymeniacidonis TaxID=340345 RepID=A0AAC9HSZ5_9PSEU|nr:ArsR family transcriptional regulator [Actinoalloteichus hymeniacidonis]AOS65029.1 transcriptional regulator, ArsR family [Actinoalloteichus hymeniacidonis]MBB5906892.1 DNA-binding transcriptional ArsR family regulator [Actinoalloteichus hymeniacidonis]